MAELTNLQSKLAEVLGLAEASKGAAETVKGMLDEDEQDLASRLDRMHKEAVETAERCIEVASSFEGKKTAIVEAARETKQEVTEMMDTYLEEEEDALDGFEFLTMAEAGEVGHWAIVKKLNERAGIGSVTELAEWALPVQEEHLRVVLRSALDLAGREDPNEVAE
jgi:hemerythrin